MALSSTILLRISDNVSIGATAMVLIISDQAITAPSTWTTVQSGINGQQHYWIGNLILGASDPNKLYTWSLAAETESWVGILVVMSGITGLDGTPSFSQAQDVNTITAPSVTTSSANELVLMLFIIESADVISIPSLTTTMGNTHIARGAISSAVEVFTQASAGATGNQTGSWSSSTPRAIASQIPFTGTAILETISISTSD